MNDNAVYLHRLSADGFLNMAVDEYLLELCRAGGARAALRFYEWEPPAVSLGRSQSFDLLDLAECREQGIDVVRRITGGGAILHWEELTYCFALRRDVSAPAAWPRQTANAVSRSLVLGLSKLGVRASARARRGRAADVHDPVAAERPAAPSDRRLTDLCFMSGVENEIEACGRKLAGCAHKFTREAFFSHGSIMTGPSHVHVARLVQPDARASQDALAQTIAEKSVALSQLLPGPPAAGQMEAAFKSAFEEVFELCLAPESLSQSGTRLVEERAAEKRSVLAAAFRTAKSTGGAR